VEYALYLKGDAMTESFDRAGRFMLLHYKIGGVKCGDCCGIGKDCFVCKC
jgi:hypothetical protein